MPNIPFYDFPSFAGVSRYEHSIGVAHLAYWWARHGDLEADTAEAVCLAALYHDAATPAFSHLFEEFLSRRGFDHEKALADILGGSPALDGGQHAQVFIGRSCRLRQQIATRARPGSLLTSTGIAELVTAKNPLGVAVHGDLDLDNIDNVIRAVTAMGIVDRSKEVHPYDVAQALTWDGRLVGLGPSSEGAVAKWRYLRRRLYESILGSKREFVAQATIKWALELCAVEDPALRSDAAWTLTEPELIHDHLRKVKRSRDLIDEIRVGRPADLLLSAWVGDLTVLLRDGSDLVTSELCSRLGQLFGCDVYINFYVDKRERPIRLPRLRSGTLFDYVGLDDPVREFDWHTDVEAAKSSNGARGLLGVIGAPSSRSRRSLRRSDLVDCASSIIQDVLGENVERADTAWLGDELSLGRTRVVR